MANDVNRIRPRGSYVLIERLPKTEETTKGGITIPSTAQLNLFKARVLALGDGIPCDANEVGLRPFDLNVGDTVLVHDDPPLTHPAAAGLPRRLVPVSATEPVYLVQECWVFAVEESDDSAGFTIEVTAES